MSNVEGLINKLDAFIKKYYTNRLIKGGIYSAALLVGAFTLFVVLEYFSEFGKTGRQVLFYTYLMLATSVLVYYVFIPLFRLYKIGKTLSYEQAAKIVGEHFGNVKDKLLNTLQLAQSKATIPPYQLELVEASINQRVEELEPVPFGQAINLSENKKYLKLLILPLLLFIGIYWWNARIITQSATRIINYNKETERIAPFRFVVENDSLKVIQNNDYTLKVKIEGDYMPNQIDIVINGKEKRLKKKNNTTFVYTFRNVQKDKEFYFKAEQYNSSSYFLRTIPAPLLKKFSVKLHYPAYTQQQDKTIENIGDLNVPEGTQITWRFETKNTDNLIIKTRDTLVEALPKKQNNFEWKERIFKSLSYTLLTQNKYTKGQDSMTYFVTVLKDRMPSITIEEKQDTINPFVRYFNGTVTDDYGFTRLEFKYRLISEEQKEPFVTENLSVTKTFNKDTYFHFIDFTKLELKPGTTVEYYFQVWDNDEINGYKPARTPAKIYKVPTVDELADKIDSSNDKIKKDIDESLKEAEALKKELKEIKKNLLEKSKPDWQDKNRLQQFLEHQQELQNKIEKVQQQNLQNQFEKNQLTEQEKEILEKQEMLNELFNELMTDEMKKLYEELQKMMEEMNKDKILEQLEDIEMNNEEVLKELDRALEQFKQLEFEEKLENITERLEDLAKKQEELSEKTKNKELSNFELNKKQEELNKAFDKVQQEMDELEQLNEELENKHQMEDTEQMEQSIDQDQQQSQEALGKKKNNKASKAQQSAAEKMQALAQQMQAMQAQDQAEQAEEDMQALKQLLENLMTFSFEQEEVMQQLKTVNYKDPKYVKLGQRQHKLKEDAQLLEDSLFALSKRVMQLGPYINKEVTEMKRNIEQSIRYIADRKTRKATASQQYTMTSANNLALLFDEALQQMQQQAKSKMPGSGSCNKPGGGGQGKPSPQSMKSLQKKMEEQLKKMKEAMEKGQKPGGKKPGDKQGEGQGKPGENGMPGQGGKPTSQQFAKMAAQQAALRKQIQELSQKLNEDGSGKGNGLKEIAKDMEKVEEDLINKRINAETIRRQQDITVRLLEHEKALREQEYDNKRKSNEAKNQKFSNPTPYNEYKKRKEKEIELLKTIPPSLKPYYKNKVNEYFERIEH